MDKKTIGIVGLGLMGGSFALALKEACDACHIVGFDHNQNHLTIAKSEGIVDEVAQSLQELTGCDAIILAIPVDAIIEAIRALEPIVDEKTTLIDLGSTKAKIAASIPSKLKSQILLAHPMTGTEKSGPTAAFSTLYEDKVVVLCDTNALSDAHLKRGIWLFDLLKMKIVYMGSKEHDKHAAFISHMPHAVSYALANAVMAQEDPQSIVALAGGGFKDMSRIAKSSPTMWEEIFKQNKAHLLEAIYSFEKELKKCRKMVENEEWAALHQWMQKANALHDILD